MILKINKVRVLIIYITILIYSNQSYSAIDNPIVVAFCNTFLSTSVLLPLSNLITWSIIIGQKYNYDMLEKKYKELHDDYKNLDGKKERIERDRDNVSQTASSYLIKEVRLQQYNDNLRQRNQELEAQLNDLSSRQQSQVVDDSEKHKILQFSIQARLRYEDTENLIQKLLESQCASGEIDFNGQEIMNKINSQELRNSFKLTYDQILKHYVLDESGKPKIDSIYMTPLKKKFVFYRDQDQQKNTPINAINEVWLYLTNHRECKPKNREIIGFMCPFDGLNYTKNEEHRLLKAAGLTQESLKNIYAMSEVHYDLNKTLNRRTVVDDKSKIRRGIFYNLLEPEAKEYCRRMGILDPLPPREQSEVDQPMSLMGF